MSGEAVISAITPSRDGARWVVKIGRRRVATLDRRGVDLLGLAVGMAWTASIAQRARAAEARLAARQSALRLLTLHGRSRAELVDRLIARGTPRAVAAGIADELVAQGLLDDLAFARSYVRSQVSSKPAARRALLAKLARKGIDGQTARRAIDEELGNVDEAAGAMRLAVRQAKAMDPTLDGAVIRRRVFAHLARRGFDEETCREATEGAMARLGRGGGTAAE